MELPPMFSSTDNTRFPEPSLDAWLADPLIRDVMASDRVTETDMLLLFRGVALRREAASIGVGRQAKPGE